MVSREAGIEMYAARPVADFGDGDQPFR
jgi:hypothetical protein